MMTTQRQMIYQDLVHLKFEDVISNLSIIDWKDDPCYFGSVQALFYVLQEDYKQAKSTLEKFKEDGCDPPSKARMYEAKLFLDIHDRKPSNKEVFSLAQKILIIDRDSAFTKSVLAKIYFSEGKPEEGKALFLDILVTYPEAKWVHKQLVRNLFQSKKYSEALKFLPEITPMFSQRVYRFLGRTFLPHPVLSSFIYTIGCMILLGMPVLMGVYFGIGAINLFLMFYGWREKDTMILGIFRIMFMTQMFFLLIYYAGLLMRPG